jgi:hypothetical protein
MYFDVYVRRSMMFKGRLLFIVAFVAVMLISANAQGAWSIPTSYLNGADTYLTNSSQNAANGPNAPHGTENTLYRIFTLAGARVHIGYVRFDLTNVTPAEGQTWATIMDGATLSVESVCNDGKNRSNRWTGVYGLTMTTAAANWPEATTTYGGGVYDVPAEGTVMTKAPGMVWTDSTHPAPGFYELGSSNDQILRLGEILLVKAGATGFPTICTSSPTEVSVQQTGTAFPVAGSLNLAPFLSSLIKEDPLTNRYVTLAIICEVARSSSDWYITTKEGVGNVTVGGYIGTMAPTLNLPNAIPEPATIALLGLGGLSLLRIRRKR